MRETVLKKLYDLSKTHSDIIDQSGIDQDSLVGLVYYKALNLPIFGKNYDHIRLVQKSLGEYALVQLEAQYFNCEEIHIRSDSTMTSQNKSSQILFKEREVELLHDLNKKIKKAQSVRELLDLDDEQKALLFYFFDHNRALESCLNVLFRVTNTKEHSEMIQGVILKEKEDINYCAILDENNRGLNYDYKSLLTLSMLQNDSDMHSLLATLNACLCEEEIALTPPLYKHLESMSSYEEIKAFFMDNPLLSRTLTGTILNDSISFEEKLINIIDRTVFHETKNQISIEIDKKVSDTYTAESVLSKYEDSINQLFSKLCLNFPQLDKAEETIEFHKEHRRNNADYNLIKNYEYESDIFNSERLFYNTSTNAEGDRYVITNGLQIKGFILFNEDTKHSQVKILKLESIFNADLTEQQVANIYREFFKIVGKEETIWSEYRGEMFHSQEQYRSLFNRDQKALDTVVAELGSDIVFAPYNQRSRKINERFSKLAKKAESSTYQEVKDFNTELLNEREKKQELDNIKKKLKKMKM